MTTEDLEKYKKVQTAARETIKFLRSFIKEEQSEKEIAEEAEKFMKQNNTKKNGKKLGERTIHGILTLAKFVESSKSDESLENLALKHKIYLESRNYPIAKYSLWLYLKSLNYADKFIKEMGLKPTYEDKLKITKKELPQEDVELVILKP